MAAGLNTVMQAYAQSLTNLEVLEKQMLELKDKAISDFRTLKSGSAKVEQIEVNDTGWQLIPAEPPDEEESDGNNGTSEASPVAETAALG